MKMARLLRRIIPSVALIFSLTSVLYAQQLAFPTAEGYGKYSVGGRACLYCNLIWLCVGLGLGKKTPHFHLENH